MPAENELRVRITADSSELKSALGRTGKDVKSFASTFADVTGGIGNTIAIVKHLAGAVSAFVSPAVEAERVASDLTAALRAQGVTSNKVRDEILAYSSALQRQSEYGDEAITEVQKLLFQLGKLEGEGLQSATKATLDLAAGLGIDLHSAALLMGKAAAGNTATLSRYGLQIVSTGNKAGDFAQVLDQVQGKFGGAAAAATQTTDGAFAGFRNMVGEMLEALGGGAGGGGLAGALGEAARAWTSLGHAVIDALSDHAPATQGAALDAELLSSAQAKLRDETNKYLQAQQFLTAAEVEALRGSNLKLSTYRDTGASLQGLIPQLDALIAMNRQVGVEAAANAAALETQRAAVKATGMDADSLTAFLARLDNQGDETAISLTILKDREKELRAEMSKLAKAGELVPEAMAKEAAALREQITLTERAIARESALARVKDLAAAGELERADALRVENEEKRKAVALDQARALAYEKSTAAQTQNTAELQRQQAVMAVSTAVANGLGNAFVGIALEGEDAADTMRNTFRQLAMDIVRQAIAMIVAKAGEAAAKTISANSGVPGPAGIALAVGGGAAIYAATVAYKDGIPGFAQGGIVGGPSGRDRVVARLTRGEEVLTASDPRHSRNGGGQAVVSLTFNSVFPPDRTQLEVILRDELMPIMRNLERRNLA